MDKQQFAARVLEAENSLYRVARSILRCVSDCEDAVQNAVLKAWEKQNTLRNEQYFKTWITRILINECHQLARRRPDSILLDDCIPPLAAAGGEPVDPVLRDAVLALPERLRIVLVLHCIEGYSVQETAGLLRIPGGTVKSRLARGRSILQEALRDTDCQEEAYETPKLEPGL